MQFKNPYWSNTQKMNMLQRWILVHSFIYYELNNNIVSDHMYDNNCVHLAELQKKYPDSFKVTNYYKAFKEFDGSTGFDLLSKLSKSQLIKIQSEAMFVFRMER